MKIVLLHSPLVSSYSMKPLALELEALGFETVIPNLTNTPKAGVGFHAHHAAQIERHLSDSHAYAFVAHSGAGSLLAALTTDRVKCQVMLDAIFPELGSSRFDAFRDPASVDRWRMVAANARGYIPRDAIAGFGRQILNETTRATFVASLVAVPVELYEEQIPMKADWPGAIPSLYLQWTEAYAKDADLAEVHRFEVRREAACHFELLNNPGAVARQVGGFLESVGRTS